MGELPYLDRAIDQNGVDLDYAGRHGRVSRIPNVLVDSGPVEQITNGGFGTLEEAFPMSSKPITILPRKATVTVPGPPPDVVEPFMGRLGRVRVYDRCFSDEEAKMQNAALFSGEIDLNADSSDEEFWANVDRICRETKETRAAFDAWMDREDAELRDGRLG